MDTMRMPNVKVKVGDKVPTWFSDEPDGMSTVLAVTPYTGKVQHYSIVIRATAPRTRMGWMEYCE